jgi:hypothetical protein
MISSLATLFVLALGLFITSSVTQAQHRTFVSGTGDDANNCLRTTPCRTFQRAHDQTTAGGEVVALDSAGYGALTITKSITISGEGFRAAVTALSGNGITINAAGATVILRELTIAGNGTGVRGVEITDATVVYIERCAINRFTQNGIRYQTNNRLFITDTTVRSNGVGGLVVEAPAGGTARINVDGSRFERNGGDGIFLTGTGSIEAIVTNSIMSENGNSGFALTDLGTGRAQISHSTAANNGSSGFFVSNGDELNIEHSVARGNAQSGMGVGSGTIRVSNSVSTNNQRGFQNLGGTFESRGNNTVRGNTTADTAGTITVIPGT